MYLHFCVVLACVWPLAYGINCTVTPVSYCPSTTLKLSPTPDVDPSQVGSEEGQNYAGIIGGVLAVCVVAILIGMSGLAVALLAGFKYLRSHRRRPAQEDSLTHVQVQDSATFPMRENPAYRASRLTRSQSLGDNSVDSADLTDDGYARVILPEARLVACARESTCSEESLDGCGRVSSSTFGDDSHIYDAVASDSLA